ncbi:MAG: tRNA uridine-5-carboxymethylaminomethyl(34) synthesis enzyme MnmG [Proteobacteria bacterium]|nr:tRNA uridine-5-carboxymethylaminomethyl(34) synthesis enzyme MnmG [Pseudomonadota bacterium]
MKILKDKQWDVVVVGGGHAGCEACLAAAKMGMSTLLITMSVDNIAAMSCNPAIGGLAKGHLVKEIDALGGAMGYVADETGIQFRTLNQKKGPAVQATRCQSDMIEYKNKMRGLLESQNNLTLKQAEVETLLWDGSRVIGLQTELEERILSKTVVITTGTFMNGLIHIGHKQFSAGRSGDFASLSLSNHLEEKGFQIGRLKTGTTPRLDGRTINFDLLEAQPGDEKIRKFSFWKSTVQLKQVPCYITFTNEKTHEILQLNIKKSAMYSGAITGVGPRYCPSIEDKITKFPDKDRHQTFLEPTSLSSVEYYPNGMSTSMPLDIQLAFLRSMKGLENVEIMRPGYAIEYDFIQPTQLKLSLEMKAYQGLFCAGQINGTSGYEEAAAQGLIAGVNAALMVQEKEPLCLLRNEAYIGVMIDDLVSKGTEEPYRMFTSRAEYRLFLREDNADQRLAERGYQIGLLSEENYHQFMKKNEQIQSLRDFTTSTRLIPSKKNKELLLENNIDPPEHRLSLESFLKKPNTSFDVIGQCDHQDELEELNNWDESIRKFVETEIKYAGYIKRQESQVNKYLKTEAVKIPSDFGYGDVGGLSREVVQKLSSNQPQTLGQAGKISGITPAAITILMVAIEKFRYQQRKQGEK